MRKRLLKHRHTIIKYFTAALLITIPLYPKFPLYSIAGSQVSVRLEDILVLVSLIVWAYLYFDPRKLLKDKLFTSLVVFWVACFVSLISGYFITDTIHPFVGLLHWFRRIEYMSPLLLGIYSVEKKEDIYFYVRCVYVVVFFAFVVGMGQKHLNWPVITTQNYEYAKGIALRYVPGSHLVSTFAGHYDLASYLILVFPTLYIVLLSSKKRVKKFSLSSNEWISRVSIFGFILMSLWLLVNTANRISLVSYLGSVIFALILVKKYKYIVFVVIISLVFVGFSSNLIDRYIRIFQVTETEILSQAGTTVLAAEDDLIPQRRSSSPTPTPAPEPFEDRSTSIRLNVEWPRAIRSVTKNPVWGTGYSSISLATDNDYLRSLGETGIAGTVALLVIFVFIVIELLGVFPIKNIYGSYEVFVIGIFSAFPGILLNMVFIDILEASKFAISFWLMVGIAVSCARQIKYDKKIS